MYRIEQKRIYPNKKRNFVDFKADCCRNFRQPKGRYKQLGSFSQQSLINNEVFICQLSLFTNFHYSVINEYRKLNVESKRNL